MLALFVAATVQIIGGQVSVDPTFSKIGPKPKIFAIKKGPDAVWIWAKETRDNQSVTFTKDFTISKPVKVAQLFVDVDNYYSLSIDGNVVAKTTQGVDDIDGWRHVKQIDVGQNLTPGRHKITLLAYNVASAAGVLVRMEVDGKAALLSDATWTAIDSAPGSPSQPATVIAQPGAGPWGSSFSGWPVPLSNPVPYLYHLSISPTQISSGDGSPDPDQLSWIPTTSSLTLKAPTPGLPWKIMLDFGKELSGRVELRSQEAVSVKVGTGESPGEALQKPYTSADVTVAPSQPAHTAYTAFRYVSLDFPSSESSVNLQVNLDHDYYPVKYRGSFECSDPLLTKLWYTGAYTAHLCMQEDIWDAPKRDRARWMGDLHVSGEVINNVFADRFLMEQTMTRLREEAQGGNPDTQAPKSHVNGIPGYSCAWLAGLADFYRHTGDLAYVKSQKDQIVTMLDFFRGEMDADGLFANKRGEWPFVDWSVDFDKDSPQTHATTHLFLVKAMHDGAFLLRAVGDTGDASRFEAWASQLTEVAREKLRDPNRTYGSRRQENAMAVFSGVADGVDRQAIYRQILSPSSSAWKQDASPYYNNYVIFAMSQLGHTEEAMRFVRSYWGGMIREGATTFWEGYDPTWDKNNSHAHLQADDGAGYFVSLCHGWSAGVTNWLTEEVLGVRPTAGGFSECEIMPDLGDLTSAKGSIPTPSGKIDCSVMNVGGLYTIEVTIPKQVRKAKVEVPNAKLHLVYGPKPISTSTGNELNLGPGHYYLSSAPAYSVVRPIPPTPSPLK